MRTTLLSNLLLFVFSLCINVKLYSQSSSIYKEEFTKEGSWTVGENDERSLYVSEGNYYFQCKKEKGYREFTTRTFYIDSNKDFEFTTSVKKISGKQDYGISFLFDYDDKDNFTEFGYTSTGYYRVAESTTKGGYISLKPWTSSSYLKQGNYATNNLKIKKLNNRLSFYINGSYVFGTDFKALKGSKMGFRLYRAQKVAIDYFRVKYIGGTGSAMNTSTSPKGKTILFEGFNSNANNWNEKNDSSSRLVIENGNYVIDHKRSTGGWSSTIKRYINSSRNFRITAQIKKVSGIDNNGFGIVFGKKDNNNMNLFVISGSGSFKISQFDKGKKKILKDWTTSSHIKKGNQKYNYLKVEKVGTAYKFYINSNLVFTSYSPRLFGDLTGFAVFDKQAIEVGYLSMLYTGNSSSSNTSSTSNNYSNSGIKHASKETILFEGYNDNRNNWSTSKNENVEFEIKNGEYYIEHKKPKGGWSSTIVKPIDTSRDFKILADIKKETGTQYNGYGIIFGRKNKDNQNLFYINGNGSYSINKIKNGKDNFKKSWTSSKTIRKGNGAYNVLKVVKLGSKLEYYINNTKVYTDYNPEFFGDRLGYIIYDNQKISVAYLSVGYLDKKKNTTNTTSNTSVTSSSLTDKIPNYTYNNSGYHFSDQFTDNSNTWYLANNDKVHFRIKNGKYYLQHKRNTKSYASYDYNYIDTSKDFEIQTKLDKIKGTDNYGYGLLFGKQDLNDFRFYISSSGYYKISKKINNREEVIKAWTGSSYIQKGNGKSNILKVKKEKGYYKFYINGTFVYQTQFQSFFGNDFGFIVYNNQEIAVDYIRVKYAGSFVND
ncbi:hypothetical protein [Tenacibaculum sp. 190524A05c]|uniref:3-keto-disaccharide hydrolase domain-containing protein n=1 Tax=Tenacibaculum platacis TaxID=3137852 RepID=A0ABP1EWQ8_9FLAO